MNSLTNARKPITFSEIPRAIDSVPEIKAAYTKARRAADSRDAINMGVDYEGWLLVHAHCTALYLEARGLLDQHFYAY